jgi:predicted Zn-dependent peptidase
VSDVLSSLYAFELGRESWTLHLELLDAVTPQSLQAAAHQLLSPKRQSITIVENRRAIEGHLTMLAAMGCVISTFEK